MNVDARASDTGAFDPEAVERDEQLARGGRTVVIVLSVLNLMASVGVKSLRALLSDDVEFTDKILPLVIALVMGWFLIRGSNVVRWIAVVLLVGSSIMGGFMLWDFFRQQMWVGVGLMGGLLLIHLPSLIALVALPSVRAHFKHGPRPLRSA